MAGAETISNGFLIVQGGVLLVTVLALVGSMMFAKRAMKASAFLREAREEAQTLYGSMDRQMQNMQMMNEEMRRMADDLAHRQDDITARLQGAIVPAAGAGDEKPEEAPARADVAADVDEEEKKPSAMFRSLLRRR